MTIFLLIIMALLLTAALEPAHRRQSPRAPGLRGSYDHDDRDWARIKADLLALGGPAEPFNRKPVALKGSGPLRRLGWQAVNEVMRAILVRLRHHRLRLATQPSVTARQAPK